MKTFNADLHYHSPYAGGVSKNMSIPVIAEQAQKKGLQLAVTSDITNKTWYAHCKKELIEEKGVYKYKNNETAFLIGTEVQCNARVHHLLYFPTLESSQAFKKQFEGRAVMDSWGTGRPVIRASAEEIALQCRDAGGVIGPAHAFTPYFGAYANHNSLKDLYGEEWKYISFLELGLSANSFYADLIEENHQYVFLSNSDSHSPWPHRIGREFNRIQLKQPDFKSFKKALQEKTSFVLNAGFDPREGKYHCSACNKCYEKYSLQQATESNWRCHCKGQIKKGVKDRVAELAMFTEETHPQHRPEYMHMLPLAEIIQLTFGLKNPLSKKVQQTWAEFVDQLGNEINVLVDAGEKELQEVHQEVADNITRFRNGYVIYLPGGGGEYGKPMICESAEDKRDKEIEYKNALNCVNMNLKQKRLKEF